MNRQHIFNEFVKFAQKDENYYTWGKPSQVGCIEDVMAYFGISCLELETHTKIMHQNNLNRLQEFVLKGATDDQVRMLHAISTQNASIPYNTPAVGSSGRVFVSMSMNSNRDADVELIRKGIEEGIKATGNEAYFLDLDDDNEDIKDKMFEQINACKFLVADFTHHITGVYYEAGYARGIGKTVIHTCRSDDMGGLHFDINSKRAVVWDNPDDLAEKLSHRIRYMHLGE